MANPPRPTPEVGSLGAWRVAGSMDAWNVATIIRNQDDGWIPGCISLRNKQSGQVQQWDPHTGYPGGQVDEPVGTGWERTVFDGMNLLATLPADNKTATVVLEWINLPLNGWTNDGDEPTS